MSVDLKDYSIKAIITDTPYGTTKCKWDSIIDLEDMWWWLSQYRLPQTPVLLFSQLPYDKVLGCSNIKELRYEWVWEKTSATGHLNAKKMPMKAHEVILTFYNKLPLYNYEKTKGNIKKEAYKKKEVQDNCDIYGESTKDVYYSSTERYPRDVLKYSSDKQKLSINSTQKPLELLRYLIRTYTNKGDTLLDFTAGSMSLAVAAYLEGRNSVCIEKDKDQYDRSVEWVRNCSELENYRV